ncbi:MAG: hypothetical protein KC729_04135 [Candidatus Eisenbacteria bacterium]|uniref:Uncharacterized protein n=1 Tax=Eiseniibacteriota bacterium TaxID=2212470 RepID=A0A956LWZ1_UNCEI|nr:hypothetical protein [Candidatus Eisenbacteria bacterium]
MTTLGHFATAIRNPVAIAVDRTTRGALVIAPCLAVLLSFWMATSHPVLAQTPIGTAFTYQGNIDLSGSPLNGTADFQFKLFGALTGGTQIGSTVTVSNLTVSNGVFTTQIDFGSAFVGDRRFLEIGVRSPAGGGGAFTTLSPRQEITSTPYALKVRGIDGFSLDASDGTPVDALAVGPNGDVGIGTTTPAHALHVVNDTPVMILQDTSPATEQSGYLGFWNNTAAETAWVGYGTPGSPHFSVVNGRAGGHIQLLPGVGGNVGIGTTAPAAKLHVNGGAIMAQNLGNQADLLWLESERDWVFRQEGSGAGTSLKLQSVGGGGNKNFIIQTDGLVGIGTLTPLAKLHVNGTTRTNVLEITGADLAERFPSSDSRVEPGTVMEIDPDHAGHLRIARTPYSPCVAGVISGANDFAAGAVLGNLPGSEDAPPVALSGRVYVRCDTSGGAIRPGDLLTTSSAPGFAMKASDLARSHGAIIGKAMEPLAEGSGLVLVLVNLQ